MRTSLEDTARSAVRDYLDVLTKRLRDLESDNLSPEEQRRLRLKIRHVNDARWALLKAEVL